MQMMRVNQVQQDVGLVRGEEGPGGPGGLEELEVLEGLGVKVLLHAL